MNKFFSALPLFIIGLVIGLAPFEIVPSYVLSQYFFYFLTSILLFEYLLHFFRKKLSLRIAQLIKITLRIAYISVLVFYLFGSMLSAQWGVIDDHEIISYLGSDRRISLSEVPEKLMSTEVGRYGQSLRYRPSYYVLRLTESVLWGWHPAVWYGARLVSLIIALVIFWYLLEENTTFAIAGLTVVYSLTLAFWSDLFTRLGPAETYGVLPLALYVLSYLKIWKSTREAARVKIFFATHFVVLLVLFGIKENFLLLMIPELVLLWKLYRHKYSLPYLVCIFIPLLYGLFVLIGVGKGILAARVDVYANTVNIPDRLQLVTNMLRNNEFQLIGAILFIVSIIFISDYFSAVQSKQIHSISKFLLIIVVASTLIFSSQFIFYNGNWPDGTRYDFPGLLVLPVLYALLFYSVISFLRIQHVQKTLVQGIYIGVLLGVSAFLTMNNIQLYASIHDKAIITATDTRDFTASIESISKSVSSNPDTSLVFESSDPMDYEQLISTALFLRSYGVENKLMLRLNDYEKISPDSKLLHRLVQELKIIENSGNDLFITAADLTNQNNCFVITFSGSQTSLCSASIRKP